MADPIAQLLKAKESIVEDLRAFVEMESPSDDKRRTDEFGDFLSAFIKGRLDAHVEPITQPVYGNHLRVEVGPRNGRRPILILGHFDTVWPAGTLARMPFRVDGPFAYGPGALDMKGGLVLGIHALGALQRARVLQGPVVFLFTSDEELGSCLLYTSPSPRD